MNIKIQQAENSIERVDNSVIEKLYNAHTNGNISQEKDDNQQNIGLVGSITADASYENWISALQSAYPKLHITVTSEYILFQSSNTELYDAVFYHCKGNIVINNTTVPTIYHHTQGQEFSATTVTDHFSNNNQGTSTDHNFNIYVPDSAVSAYRTAWPSHTQVVNGVTTEHIKGISELNNGIIYATEADWTTAGKPAGLIAEYLGLNASDLATFISANNLTYWTNPNT